MRNLKVIANDVATGLSTSLVAVYAVDLNGIMIYMSHCCIKSCLR